MLKVEKMMIFDKKIRTVKFDQISDWLICIWVKIIYSQSFEKSNNFQISSKTVQFVSFWILNKILSEIDNFLNDFWLKVFWEFFLHRKDCPTNCIFHQNCHKKLLKSFKISTIYDFLEKKFSSFFYIIQHLEKSPINFFPFLWSIH